MLLLNNPELLFNKADEEGEVMSKYTDAQIYQALVSQVQYNPTGATAIDVFSGLGIYQQVSDALERLEIAGKLKQTSPGNYLPVETRDNETQV